MQRKSQHLAGTVGAHAITAFLHQPQRGLKIQRPGGDQGAILTETVTAGQDRFDPVVGQFAENFQAGQRVNEQGGLGVAGKPQVFFRPFQAKLDEIVAQNVVGLLVKPPGDWKIPAQVAAHTDVLGTLSRKYEHDLLVLTRHGQGPPVGG